MRRRARVMKTANRWGSSTNRHDAPLSSGPMPIDAITTSRSLPWKAWTVPTRRSRASSSSAEKAARTASSMASAWARKGVTTPTLVCPPGPGAFTSATTRSTSASDDTARVAVAIRAGRRRRSPSTRSGANGSRPGPFRRRGAGPRSPPGGDSSGSARRGRGRERPRRPGRRCCCGGRRDGRRGQATRRARAPSRPPELGVGNERDLAQLAGVAGYDGSPAPEEGGRSQRLVDRRRLVEDHQVEKSGPGAAGRRRRPGSRPTGAGHG